MPNLALVGPLKEKTSKKWNMKPVIITILVGLAIIVVFALGQGIISAQSSAELMRILGDTFTVAGGLLIAGWVFSWASGEGMFNMFAYTAANIRRLFTSKKKSLEMDDRDESYGDFVERRKVTGRGRRYLYILIVGIVYFILGVLFSVLFFRVGG